MKISVVQSSEIAKCPLRMMTAEHYIPEHRIEECNSELRRLLAAFDYLQKVECEAASARVRKRQAREREEYMVLLRKED